MPITSRPNRKFYELAEYQPFEIQHQIHQSRKDIRVVCVGRQVGKSEAASIEACFELFTNPGCTGWVVAPTYEQAEIVFNRTVQKAEKLADRFPNIQILVQTRRLRLRVLHYSEAPAVPGKFTGMRPVAISEFRGKSADRPENLKGATLNFVIFDEAALIDWGVWSEAIQPMLSTTKGWALFISTPKGYNWFHTFFKKGWCGKLDPGPTTPPPTPKSERDPNFESFHAASWEVRLDVGQEWYDNARRNTPDLEFRQEYGAEFISHSGSVFKGLDNIVRFPYQEIYLQGISQAPAWVVAMPYPEGEYVIGADFGKHQDFSVFTVVDLTDGKVVCMLRTNETSWKTQIQMLSRLSLLYNQAPVVADTWGVGDVLKEDIELAGLSVVEAPFRNASLKEEYIKHLALLIENGLIAVPDVERIFIELRGFQYHTTTAGNTTMRAYGRGNDDIVVSLALAYHLYDGGGLLEFDYAREKERMADYEGAVAAADIFEDLEGVDLDYELAEANRMFR